MAAAERIAPLLADAGFPALARHRLRQPQALPPGPVGLARSGCTATRTPAGPVNLHVRAVGSPGWRFALCFRDWLRDDAAARADYLAEKRRVAKLHGVDKSTAGYAADKEAWFTELRRAADGGVGAAHRLAPAVVHRPRSRGHRTGAAPGRLPPARYCPKLNQGTVSEPGGRLDT